MSSPIASMIRGGALAAIALTTAVAARPAPAHACGGLFCSSANPVNQSAERILFVENGDGTVTAVIQILYEGPSSKFAWVLPVAGSPEVGVSSNVALSTLQQLTNPTYQLTTMTEGSCGFRGGAGLSGAASGAGGGFAAPMNSPGTVNQVASGSVGPYDYTVISVIEGTEMPETAAIDWLTENGFDVGALGPEVLRPYLEEGLNLIAFKLQKGSDTGSIRPILLTYKASRPSIPIRPTAVAANDDMGVMVWTLSDGRGVPANYKALELNEALINWFNPSSNYNEVVTRAADEAMGQGFVTEYAGRVDAFVGGLDLFPDWQEQQWEQFTAKVYSGASDILEASQPWSAWDGYDDARRRAVTLPETISYEDFLRCTPCYINDPAVVFDTQRFMRELYELVIKPVIETDKLLKSRPYLTRLYTTMSADEMTMDPLFDFNGDLPDVSNVHTANRYVRCDSGEWRAELGEAGTVQGSTTGAWPVPIDSQPAAMKILEYGTSGMGRVIEDRAPMIKEMNKAAKPPLTGGTGGTSMMTAGRGGTGTINPRPSETGGTGSVSTEEDGPKMQVDGDEIHKRGSGCAVAPGGGDSLAWLLLACAALLRRRTKRRAA